MAAIRIPALLLLGVLTFATLATTTQAQFDDFTLTIPIVVDIGIGDGVQISGSIDSTAEVPNGEPASAPGPSPGRKLLQFLPPNPLLGVNVDVEGGEGGEGVEIKGLGPIDVGVEVSLNGEPTSAPGPSPGRKLLQD